MSFCLNEKTRLLVSEQQMRGRVCGDGEHEQKTLPCSFHLPGSMRKHGLASLPRRRTPTAHWVVDWATTFLIAMAFGSVYLAQDILGPNALSMAEQMGVGVGMGKGIGDEETRRVRSIAELISVLALPLGTLLGVATDCPDNGRRCFALWVLLGAFSMLGMATSATLVQFFVYHLCLCLTMGGVFPVVFMLVADMYPPEKRKTRAGLVGAFMPLSAVVGQVLGDMMTLDGGYGWRVVLVIMALPGVVLSLAVVCFVYQPIRGSQEKALEGLFTAEGTGMYRARLSWSSFCSCLSTKTNLLLLGQCVPGGVPLGVVYWYIHDLLTKEEGMYMSLTTTQAVTLLGVTLLGSAIVGIGIGNQQYQGKFLWPLLLGASMIVTVPPMLLMINLDYHQSRWPLIAVCAFATGSLGSINGTCVRTMLMNTNVPEARGALLGLAHVASTMGLTMGPRVSQAVLHALGVEEGSGVGLFNVSLVFWAMAGVLLLLGTLTFEEDLTATEEHLRKIANQAHMHTHTCNAARDKTKTMQYTEACNTPFNC